MEFYYANLDEIFKYLSDAVSQCTQNVSGNNAPVCRLRSMAARARARQCLHPSRRVREREREPVVADVLLLCITNLRQHWQGRLIHSILSDYYFITSQRSPNSTPCSSNIESNERPPRLWES